MRLNGSVALVTGAASGIGRGIALGMAREGANVVIADINLEGAQKVVGEIQALGREALAFKTDVSKSQEVKEMVRSALGHFSHIDILVNDAGGTARIRAIPFYQSTEEMWDYVLGINLKGVMNCSWAILSHMRERKKGCIISIASIAGVLGMEGRADYSAAKAGIIAFTRALAKEVASQGIRVVAISPGAVEGGWFPRARAEDREALLQQTRMGRIGKPEDIANLAVFLASEEASYITGHNFISDGGWAL